MPFIIQGKNDERVVYVGKPDGNKFALTTSATTAKRFHFVASAERYAKSISVLFDLFPEYTWTIVDIETGQEASMRVELPEIVDIDEIDESKIRCNY